MTLGLFKIVGHELKKTFAMFLLIGLILISLFSTINTLSTLTFSFMNSFLSSYGYSWFNLTCVGLNNLDKIDELNKDEYILSLYGATGYTQPDVADGDIRPYFYKSTNINAFTDVFCFNFSNNTSINIEANNLNDFIRQLDEQGIDPSSYEYFKSTLLGEYCVFNSALIDFLSDYFVEYDQDIEDNSIFINSIIAQQNNLKLKDTIQMNTVGGEVAVKISGIFDAQTFDRSFICNIKSLNTMSTSIDHYYVQVKLTNNANFTKNYNYFNLIFNEEQFTYDTYFLRTYNMVKALYAIIIVLLISFVLIGIITTYEFTKIIIEERKKFIYYLKLIGSQDKQIIFIYFLIFIPLILVISIFSYFISELFIWIIATKTASLFDWVFISQFNFVSPIILAIIVCSFFVLAFHGLLNKHKRSMTYTLYRETV